VVEVVAAGTSRVAGPDLIWSLGPIWSHGVAFSSTASPAGCLEARGAAGIVNKCGGPRFFSRQYDGLFNECPPFIWLVTSFGGLRWRSPFGHLMPGDCWTGWDLVMCTLNFVTVWFREGVLRNSAICCLHGTYL
jgi:hypothetical protein